MIWYVCIGFVLLIGAAVVYTAGRDAGMADAADDRPDVLVPTDRPLTADDLGQVRFSTALRGYRMDEVDDLIARLRADMYERDHPEPGPDAG